MKVLIMQWSSPTCYYLPLRPRYLRQHSILEHPQSVFLPSTETQVPYPYGKTCKIMCGLIFLFLDVKRTER